MPKPSVTMKLEVTIDSYPKDGVHVVVLQAKNPQGWGGKTVQSFTDDPSVGNAVRQAVMDLIALTFQPELEETNA